jgi:methylthioribose-1-phosphate isomerase
MKNVLSVEWIAHEPDRLSPGHVRILDQTRLPGAVVYVDTQDVETVFEAIRSLRVRGAPAIGVAAAMGVAAAACATAGDVAVIRTAVEQACSRLAASRPTAVNLFWALGRMRGVVQLHSVTMDTAALKESLAREAVAIRDEDAACCRAIGRHGFELIRDMLAILTHCNAGGLATAEYGTALAPVYMALEHGKKIRVYADETRPLLQGARLTAWELQQAGVPVTLICDNTAAQVMREGRVDAVLVGADRIAANGDTANKVGTYGVALLAKAHAIPFYVLAPTSTFDLSLKSGDTIPIEVRAAEEVTCWFGGRTSPEGVDVYSPAFDVTPAGLIAAIVCENGVARPDYTDSLARLAAKSRTGASPAHPCFSSFRN